MSMFEGLKVGSKLHMDISKKQLTGKGNYLISTQLIDMKDKQLYIATPILKGVKYPLYEKQKVGLLYNTDKGVYKFDAEVIQRIESNITSYVLLALNEPEKIQRRSYFRLPVVTNIIVKKFEKDKEIEFKSVTKDLSANGMKMVSNYELKAKDTVIVDIYLSEKDTITVKGEVIRSIKDVATNTYEVGIKFKSMNVADEDKIISYIFTKQRLLRQKGLI